MLDSCFLPWQCVYIQMFFVFVGAVSKPYQRVSTMSHRLRSRFAREDEAAYPHGSGHRGLRALTHTPLHNHVSSASFQKQVLSLRRVYCCGSPHSSTFAHTLVLLQVKMQNVAVLNGTPRFFFMVFLYEEFKLCSVHISDVKRKKNVHLRN